MTKLVLASVILAALAFPGSASATAKRANIADAQSAPVTSDIILAQSTTNNGARGGGTGAGNGHGNNKGQGAARNNPNGRF